MVGGEEENQRKTREKSNVAENQVFWLDFWTKKGLFSCIHPIGSGFGFGMGVSSKLKQPKLYIQLLTKVGTQIFFCPQIANLQILGLIPQ
jgi:hypothetical protein